MDIFTPVLFVWLAWVLLVVEDSGSSMWTQGWKAPEILSGPEALAPNDKSSVTSPGSPRRVPQQKCGDHHSQKRTGNAARDYFMYDLCLFCLGLYELGKPWSP